MILNVWTITSLFLAGVGAALAVVVFGVALRGVRAGGGADPEALADRGHLLLLGVAVLAGVRFLAWPHFYLLLKSYVPDLAPYGVMCVFGVTRVEAGLVGGLEWGKPLLLLALGFWLLTAHVDGRAKTPVLRRVRLVAALPLAVMVIAECVAEIAYVFREKIGRPVTCCTTFRETPAGDLAENLSPIAGVSGSAPAVTLGLLFGLGVLVVIVAAVLARGRAVPAPALPAVALAGLGTASLVVTQWGWTDVVAPRVLGLPYHHCVYELVTDVPALSLAAVLVVAGHGALWWPVALLPWRRRAAGAVAAVQRQVWAGCAVAVASGLLIVAVLGG